MLSSGYGLRKKAIKSERGRTLDSIHKGGLARAAIKKQLFTVGGEALEQIPQRSWNAICLGVYRARLDGTLSNLSSGMCPCLWQEGWEIDYI